MKNILILTCLLALGALSFSQSNQFGTLNLSGGLGLGVYATNSEFTATYFNGGFTVTDRDTSAAATTYGYFSGDFGLIDILSVGIFYQGGKYLQEEETGKTKDNAFFKFGIMPKIYLLNKNKFNLYTGLGLGVERLRTSEVDNNNTKTEAKYSGSNFHLRLGMNVYFTDFIGLFLHAGYDANNLNLKQLTFTNGNTTNEPSNLSGSLDAKGMELAIGLNIKFSAGK